MSGLQRTPKAEHPSRKRTVSQSSASHSSGASSGKEGGGGRSSSSKSSSTAKHRKGEDKQGRSAREGKVGAAAYGEPLVSTSGWISVCLPSRKLVTKPHSQRWNY